MGRSFLGALGLGTPPVVGGSATGQPAPPVDAAAPSELPPDLAAACDKHLSAHRFKATPRPEIVAGDMQCDFWLDDRLVTQEGVRAALLAALPKLASWPIPLARLVAERWDLELRQALVFSGRTTPQSTGRVSKPEGVLTRAVDGQSFWEPAPIATMAGSEPVADDGWLKDFFEFYDLAPGPDPNKPGSCRFDGAEDTLDGVVRKAGEQAALAGYKPNPGAATSIARTILDRRAAARRQGAAIAAAALTGANKGPAKEPDQGLQLVPSIGIAYTAHWELTPLPTKQADPPTDVVYQFQFGVNDVRHPKDSKGPELQGALVVGYNDTTRKWQLLAGGQFVAVLAIWGRVQLQYFANLQAGIARKLSEAKPSRGVFQGMTGAQVAITLGPAQIGVQLGGGGTISEGPPTGDLGGAIGVSIPLDVKPGKKTEPPPRAIDTAPLEKLSMPDLLDALEAVRDAGQMDKLATGTERIRMATLVVLGEIKEAIALLGKSTLAEADRDALRKYLYRSIGRSSK